MHEANGRSWDASAAWWTEMRDRDGLWRRCPTEPDLGFAGGALELIGDFAGDVEGMEVCVIGSGDNYAAFALAGMKAHVTSIDISGRQLETASERAAQLGLPITFVEADASDLKSLADRTFEFNWTLADILNPAADAGLSLRRILERPAEDPSYWEGSSYLPGEDSRMVDWRDNPRAALPAWFSAALQKPL